MGAGVWKRIGEACEGDRGSSLDAGRVVLRGAGGRAGPALARRRGSRRSSTPSCSRRSSPSRLPSAPYGARRTEGDSSGSRRVPPRTLSAARLPSAACRTSFCSEREGQASVEAAALVPVVMLVLAMLLQPAFLLYTRAIMHQAAAGGLRVLVTREPGGVVDEEACRSYVMRRLSSVPDVAAFHVGGEEGWEVSVIGDASSGEVSVEVSGRLRPLPIVGVVAAALGEPAGDEVVLRASATERARPEWLEGGYGDWISMWS